MENLPSVRNLSQEAFQIYKSNFWNYLGIALVAALAAMIIGGVFLTGIGLLFFGAFPFDSSVGILILIGIVVVAVAVIVAGIVLQLWAPVALLTSARDANPLSVVEAFKQSRIYVIPYLVASFLSGLAVFGAIMSVLVPLLIVIAVLGLILQAVGTVTLDTVSVSNIVSIMVLALLTVPTVIMSVWLNFVSYAIVIDNQVNGGVNILAYSKELVRGRWWAVAGRMAFLIVIALIVSLFFSILIELTGLTILVYLNNLFTLLLAPWFIFYMLALYRRLVVTRGEIEVMETHRSHKLIHGLVWIGLASLIVIGLALLAAAVV